MSGAVLQPKTPAARRIITRRPLLSSCAVAAALVAFGHAVPVRAQAFQAGTPTQVLGNVTLDRSTPGIETITVETPTAVLNWVPTDSATGGGAINFLPSGNTATFRNGANTSNFTILNRILPVDSSRAVQFNGTVLSRLFAASGAPTNGGSVWFYSPGGIIVGSTAFFDIGNLVLSASDIDFSDGSLFGSSGQIRFRGATDSRASVTIQPGVSPGIPQISAPAEGSYVALVAPRITQGGNVNVNGSAAYVAAESADITINGGLFDIQVQTGSAVNSGGETTLTHSGTTTGPAPISSTDPHAIYMVAMPKNDAITMLVGGTLGYAAASATSENGTVVLSAGYNVAGFNNLSGGVSIGTSAGPAPSVPADIRLTSSTVTSALAGFATRDATVDLTNSSASFASSLYLTAVNNAAIKLNNSQLLIDGDATLDARAFGNSGSTGANAQGGTASITLVNNSTLETNRITGSGLSLLASGFGGTGLVTGGNGTGGTALVSVDNSDLTVVSTVNNPTTLLIDASGSGGNADTGGTGGIGQGGTASLTISGASSNVSANEIDLVASGSGGDVEFGYGSNNGGTGGSGMGGVATFLQNAGALSASFIEVDASGRGGDGGFSDVSPIGGPGGLGQGGTARFLAQGGTASIGALEIFADGRGGFGQFGTGFTQTAAGGAGLGGTAELIVGGDVTLDSLLVSAEGRGGDSFAGTTSGEARGGIARATVSGGVLTINASGTLSAVGTLVAGEGGSPADAFGGTAAFLVENGGSFTLGSTSSPGSFLIDASAQAGSTSNGLSGNATGGSASFTAVDTQARLEGSLTISADGTGGSSFSGGNGGNGTGGTASLVSTGGVISVSSFLTMTAAGDGGRTDDIGDGGIGRGGTASILSEGGSLRGIITLSTVSLDASGNGGDAESGYGFGAGGGDGGAGIGGTASFEAVNGTIAVNDSLLPATLIAEGFGGQASNGGSGGNGSGGTVRVTSSGTGLINAVAGLSLDAAGTGGGSSETGYGSLPPGNGGSGTGGTAELLANGGQIDAPFVELLADGVGGSGSNSFFTTGTGGIGGAGTGGQILVGTGGGTLGLTALLLLARAQGGEGGSGGDSDAGGNGGNATGGSVTLRAGNSAFDLRPVGTTIDISASGGSGGDVSSGSGSGPGAAGGNGGNATGGTFTLASSGTGGALTVSSNIFSTTPPNVEASPPFSNEAFGGSGGSGGFGTTGGRGGNGGNAVGGTVEFATALGSVTVEGTGPTIVSVTATAGDGGLGGDSSTTGNTAGAGGDGGDGTGGTVRVNVAGGTVNLGDNELYAHGNGGFGGQGGTSLFDPIPPTPSVQAASGANGSGFGGLISINSADDSVTGSAGLANLGTTLINPEGFFNDGFTDNGGRVEIYDNGAGSGTGIRFASLDVLQQGFVSSTDQATGQVFDLFSASRRIRVDGDANLTLDGPAYIRASGTGGLDVSGRFSLTSLSFAQVEHDAQPATPANTINADAVSITTDLDLTALPDSQINAANAVDIASTFGAITINAASAGTFINLAAPGNINAGTLKAGNDITVKSGSGGISLASATASGFIDLDARNSITLGTLIAGTDLEVDAGYDPSAPDDSNVVANTNAGVTAGNLTSTGGEIDIEATGSVSGGNLSAGHELSISALNGSVTLASGTAGTLNVPAGPGNRRAIGIAALGDVTITGNAAAALDVGIVSGTGSVSVGSVNAGSNAVFLAANNVTLGPVTAPGLFYIANASMLPTLGTGPDNYNANNLIGVPPVPVGGRVTLTGAANAGPVVIASSGQLNFTNITSSGIVNLIAGTTASGTRVDAGASVGIDAFSGLSLATVKAGTGIDLSSANGGILVSNDISAPGTISAFARNVTLNALGDLSLFAATASAGDLIVNSGGALAIGTGAASNNIVLDSQGTQTLTSLSAGNGISTSTPGQINATNLLAINLVSVDAGGTFSLDGALQAAAIDVASADIAIGSSAVVGNAQTTSLRFTNNGASRTVIGGTGDAGYSLSNTEFGRLQAQTIEIFGPSTGTTSASSADLVVRDLMVRGTQAGSTTTARQNLVGPSGTLRIASDGSMRIEGNVAVSGAGADDLLAFTAVNRIDLITPSGSLSVRDDQGGLAGRIAMSAPRIFSGSDLAAQDIAALTDVDEIDERLGTNDGLLKPEGYIEANSLSFSFSQALLIQNSGGPGLGSVDRAGFTAGTGGVSLATSTSGQSVIIVNGRQANGSGGFVGGKDLIPLLRINGQQSPTSGFHPRSTANGCLIIGVFCRFDMQPTVPPVQDVVDQVTPPENAANQDGTQVVQALNLPTIQFVDDAGLSFAPLIEEPVTGAGNDDFWTGEPDEEEKE